MGQSFGYIFCIFLNILNLHLGHDLPTPVTPWIRHFVQGPACRRRERISGEKTLTHKKKDTFSANRSVDNSFPFMLRFEQEMFRHTFFSSSLN